MRLGLQSDGRQVRLQTGTLYRNLGLGDQYTSDINTGASIAQSGLSTTTSILKQIGTIGGPMGQLISAAGTLLIQVGSLIAKQFEGCGSTCTMSSDDANEVGDIMLQN